MARPPISSGGTGARRGGEGLGASGIDDLLLSAMERGDESLQTGRYIMTYKPDAVEQGLEHLRSLNLRTADARDFEDQAVEVKDVGDADALVFPEIGAALVSGAAFESRGLSVAEDIGSDSPIETIEPEYFAFADDLTGDYLRGFQSAVEAIAADFGGSGKREEQSEVDAQVFGATWGLIVTKAILSSRSGAGIRVAVLDTGVDLTHPDFAGRTFATATFVSQPVQDLHGHGTHCIGTACGPNAPPGFTPRYGIGYQVAPIFVGKVLTNAGSGSTASVLAGMNWAIANKCAVISLSLGANTPVQAAYTAAGQAALNKGCLIVAAAGNSSGGPTGAPANSPTIMSVSSVDKNLSPSSFSSVGKVELAAPGRDVFSAAPMPKRYATMSGTSMATPHVAGCAALWAQTSASLRGQALWNKLLASTLPLPFPPARIGKGLVQAAP